MAMLRNLRNFLINDVSKEVLEQVAERISDDNEVIRSKQFPFRFLSAYREIKSMEKKKTKSHEIKKANLELKEHIDKKKLMLDALEKAVLATSQNIAGFDEHTRVLMACDVSRSMFCPISQKKSVKNYDIGLVLSMLLKNRCRIVLNGIFGSDWKVINLPSSNILNNVELMYERAGEVGYSTNGYKVIEYLNDKGIVMDGRDIGTVVFPDAELKVFVTADPMVRAQRRYDELRAKGDTTTTLDEVLHNVTERDRIDTTRAESPLRQADDAVVLDNSNMTIPEQNAFLRGAFLATLAH